MTLRPPQWRKLYNGEWGVVLNDGAQHEAGKERVTVESRSGERTTVVLLKLVTRGPAWQLWSVQRESDFLKEEAARAASKSPVQAHRPTIRRRRDGTTQQLPVLPPEPPPPTDADAPSWMQGTPTWPEGMTEDEISTREEWEEQQREHRREMRAIHDE